ncbi:MAG: DUF4231 domain-containing protein [Haliscomenobacteraceae bacterium CHB4]|nr:hypothetical protein [Saprospiraceae bacterium]MCE7923672.1 DUF4231 domain-containing protein [Haliscomenobacteraceae bacterium CHB4]
MEMKSKTKMSPEEYLELRVDDQYKWYEKKSARNKRWFFTSQSLVIICSALIPLCVGYSDNENLEWLKYVGGFLGAIVAILGGVMSLKKYRENWRLYRASAEALQREKYLYFNRIGSYDDPDEGKIFKLFVERVEQILASENTLWASVRAAKTEENGQD